MLCTTLGCLVGCDDDSRERQLDTLRNAREKELTGEEMTESEERTLESFNKWKENEEKNSN